MAKHQVQISPNDPNYRLLSVTQDIHRGGKILAELPLAELKVGLTDIYDPDRFYNPGVMHNGVKCLEKMEHLLSQSTVSRLRALYNKDNDNSVIGLIATNVFGHDDLEDGQEYTVLRIYDEISRIDHSCAPNAVMEYHVDRGMGVLRAIMPITAGDEVFINYLVREEHSLISRENRQDLLRTHYGFTCQCPKCGLGGRQENDDNSLRRKALRRFKALLQPYPDQPTWRTETRTKLTKLTKATEYVDYLQQLDIIDGRLGWAYRKVGDIHKELYEIARDSTPPGENHCEGCRDNGGRVWHLQKAREACNNALQIDIRVHGPNEIQVRETQAQTLGIAHDRQRED